MHGPAREHLCACVNWSGCDQKRAVKRKSCKADGVILYLNVTERIISMIMQEYNIAVVLAAGKGSRMGTEIPKQYLQLSGHPVIWYSLHACEENPQVHGIIFVCGHGESDYCQKQILDPYGFKKVTAVVEGGAQRYDSVWNALKEIRRQEDANLIPKCTYVFVQDGARPMLNHEILSRSLEGVRKYEACAAGMPVKDTIKICDEDGTVRQTPDRSSMWIVQTPQTFSFDLLYHAYEKMYDNIPDGITDDAMVVEQMTDHKVVMVKGAYQNIKITTPEDLVLAEMYLKNVLGL